MGDGGVEMHTCATRDTQRNFRNSFYVDWRREGERETIYRRWALVCVCAYEEERERVICEDDDTRRSQAYRFAGIVHANNDDVVLIFLRKVSVQPSTQSIHRASARRTAL